MMRIAILGAGNVGGTLGASLAAEGHEVQFAVRDPKANKYEELVKKAGKKTRASAIREAVADAEVVILATPWPATQQALKEAGDLAGKILLDCTNPLKSDLSGLSVDSESSGGEMVADWAQGAKVYKVFNQTGFNIMADPILEGRKSLMLVCGDDEDGKPIVLKLAEEVGFEAVDFGKLSEARLLESLALIWVKLAYQCGLGREIALALLRR
jgi:predicted dinucleotide-binding enzyme